MVEAPDMILPSFRLVNVEDMILGIDAFIHQQVKDMKAFKEYLWENLSELDRAEKSATRNNVTQAAMSAEEMENTKRRLKRMKLVPYFGRIDFRADGEDEATAIAEIEKYLNSAN